MEIELEYVSFLDLPNFPNNSTVQVDQGLTVGEFLKQAGLTGPDVRHITAFVNGEQGSRRQQLKDGDRIFLYLPAGGG